MRLREAHTIGEALQEEIEKLPEVERAFVHIDFESTHKPEHKVRSRLPATDPWEIFTYSCKMLDLTKSIMLSFNVFERNGFRDKLNDKI